MRAIAVPRRGIGDVALAILAEQARAWNLPLLARRRGPDRSRRCDRTSSWRSRRSPSSSTGCAIARASAAPVTVMEEIVQAIQYETMLAAEGAEGLERWENVRELMAAAAEWSEVIVDEDDPGTPLQRFLAEAALLSAVDTQCRESRTA